MNIKLDMPVGEYRELTKEEFKELNHLISESTKVFKHSIARPRTNKKTK